MKTNKLQAYLDDVKLLTVLIDQKLYKHENQLSIYHKKLPVSFHKIKELKKGGVYKVLIKVDQDIDLKEDWKITLDEALESEILSGKVVRTKSFIEANNYQGDDLGVIYSKTHSTFKIWAPIAKKIYLCLESPSGHYEELLLKYDCKGTWTIKIKKNLEGYTYIYKAYVNGGWKKVKDPYAVSSKANGEIQYIIDPLKTYEMKHSYKDPNQVIIYEICVRDFSSDKTINFKHSKKYLALIEEGLKTKKGKAIAFDYIKDLGISHIQLLPIFDFTGVDELNQDDAYNWGYNPSQYFVPEGSYSFQVNDPYQRINDLKKVIDTYHKNDLGIIMDVVYNHVDNHLKFPYEILTPGYSFRVDDIGIMTDFSGCKNDLDSSRPMIKKLIIDSLLYWLKNFKIDGFRFDLMGLIDYNTMNEVYQLLKKIHPNILIYGEGWKIDDNDNLAHMYNSQVNPKISFFNDQFRDLVKGSSFKTLDTGYAFGDLKNLSEIKNLYQGQGLLTPQQSINFVECHDNQTFFDKAIYILKDKALARKHQIIANSLTILGPGTPFIHFGQEFYRTKNFADNSYNLSDDINQVKWNDLDDYQEDIDFFKKIIAIRKSSKPYQITNIEWIDSTLILSIGKYRVYFIVNDTDIFVDNHSYLLVCSSSNTVNDKKYNLKDIGVYVFERK